MSRRRKGRDVHGVVLLDKPEGLTSNRAVQIVRRLFQARKAGHTGSLDPFATGMLPICLGEASKTAGFMLDASKSYIATARLGQATATGDTEGEVICDESVPDLDSVAVEKVLDRFTGPIEQIPPMYSALKHQGQPLYRLARSGQEVTRESRTVTIHALDLLAWRSPFLDFRVHCAKGTYVRTLAEDIAEALGSCAHLTALRRLACDPFDEDGMITLEDLEAGAEAGDIDTLLLPPDAGLQRWPVVDLDDEPTVRFCHGNPVPCLENHPGLVRVYSRTGALLGIGEVTTNGHLKPRRIMNLAT